MVYFGKNVRDFENYFFIEPCRMHNTCEMLKNIFMKNDALFEREYEASLQLLRTFGYFLLCTDKCGTLKMTNLKKVRHLEECVTYKKVVKGRHVWYRWKGIEK